MMRTRKSSRWTERMLSIHSAQGRGIASARREQNANPILRLAYVEMRVILARLLWNFDLELANKDDDWLDQKAFLAWDKKPLMVNLKPVKRG